MKPSLALLLIALGTVLGAGNACTHSINALSLDSAPGADAAAGAGGTPQEGALGRGGVGGNAGTSGLVDAASAGGVEAGLDSPLGSGGSLGANPDVVGVSWTGGIGAGGAPGSGGQGGSGGASGVGGSGGTDIGGIGGNAGGHGGSSTGGSGGAGTGSGGTGTSAGGSGAPSGGTFGSGGASAGSGGTIGFVDAGSSSVPQCQTIGGVVGWAIPGQAQICEDKCMGCTAVCLHIGTRSEGWGFTCSPVDAQLAAGCNSIGLIVYAICH